MPQLRQSVMATQYAQRYVYAAWPTRQRTCEPFRSCLCVRVCLCVCVCLAVCAKRSSRRDVEFIDDDFAAIPLPSFGRRLRERGCRRGWGAAGRLQLSERPTSDLRFGYAFTHALTFFSPIHFEFLFLFLAYIVGRLLRLFLMCVRHLSGSLSCLAAAMATSTGTATTSASGSGLRNGLQFYFGYVTNAISVSHMCKNVFRFMRAQLTACLALMPSDSQAQRGPQDCSLAQRVGVWSWQEGGKCSLWLSELRITCRTLAVCACFKGTQL